MATEFATSLEAALAELAMEQTRFEVRFDEHDESAWTGQGVDRVEFFVSPNPGEDLRPLARIVSGGELSRIMLAVKTLVATSRHEFGNPDDKHESSQSERPAERGLSVPAKRVRWAGSGRPEALEGRGTAAPGLIFDEVDAGIGGRVADVVGRKLRALGSAFQVLCITHLPQIAAYADTHFQIDKRVEAGRTRTSVVRLDAGARIEEISRMLGGAGVTDGIRASAREMLERRALPSSPTRVASAGQAASRPAGATARQAKGESERAKVNPERPRR